MHDESFQLMAEIEKKHWWFKVRRELVVFLLKKYSTKKTNIKILDVGCGTGLNSIAFKEFGEVYSLDPSEAALKYCKEKGLSNLYLGNAEKLPFDDSTFDVVVALDVVEHIKDDIGVVKEIKRVLKPGGIFICFVPAFMFLWSEQDKILMHYRRYSYNTFNLLFHDNWECLKISYFNFFLFPFIFLLRFIKKMFRIKQTTDEIGQMAVFNPILYWIFKRELFLLNFKNFPFGVSLLAVYKKI